MKSSVLIPKVRGESYISFRADFDQFPVTGFSCLSPNHGKTWRWMGLQGNYYVICPSEKFDWK